MKNDIEKLKEKVKELEEKLASLRKEIENETKLKKKTIHNLEIGDKYWVLNGTGVVEYFYNNDYIDSFRINHGFAFLTEQEALNASRHMIIRAKLQRYADELWAESGTEIDWDDWEQCKYYLTYAHRAKCVVDRIAIADHTADIIYFPYEIDLHELYKRVPEEDVVFYLTGGV